MGQFLKIDGKNVKIVDIFHQLGEYFTIIGEVSRIKVQPIREGSRIHLDQYGRTWLRINTRLKAS